MESTGKIWHTEVISSPTEETFQHLSALESIRNFYLAGGTGLALHLGHRRSVDLDLFCARPFDEEAILADIRPLPNIRIIARAPQTLHLHIAGTKVSFLGYNYPVLFPFEYFRKFAVAAVLDIAGMKLNALANRGTKRDFVDLYSIAQNYELVGLLAQFERKFEQVHYNRIHVLKSLVYFADAEKDPMPDMLVPLSWQTVKSYFLQEVLKLDQG
jgi:hypothetical protein